MIIFRLFSVIGLDGAADFLQQFHRNLAGGVAQVVEDGGGGKLADAPQILVLQIVGGVQAAAGQNGVLDAGGQKVPIAHFQIEVIQSLQKTAFRIIGEVGQIVPVDLPDGAADLFHELIAKVRFLGGAVLPLQSIPDGPILLLVHFPQIRRFRAPDRPGIRHIVNIPQPGLAPSILVNEGDAR